MKKAPRSDSYVFADIAVNKSDLFAPVLAYPITSGGGRSGGGGRLKLYRVELDVPE